MEKNDFIVIAIDKYEELLTYKGRYEELLRMLEGDENGN